MRFPRSRFAEASSHRVHDPGGLRDTRPAIQRGRTETPIPNTRGVTEDLTLDRFLLDGNPVEAKTLQVQTISPGVHEITAEAAQVGEWEFAIKDLSNYLRIWRALQPAGPRPFHPQERNTEHRRRQRRRYVQAGPVFHTKFTLAVSSKQFAISKTGRLNPATSWEA